MFRRTSDGGNPARIGAGGRFRADGSECLTILLAPGRLLDRLPTGPVLALPALDRSRQKVQRRWIWVRLRDRSVLLERRISSRVHSVTSGPWSFCSPSPCPAAATRPPSQAAAAPPSVTVAQPVKRTVTDWDEFTGRFEAVEEVQVRARVGGFVTSVEFRDGAFVKAGDLLYVIDARPFEAVAEQADGQLADARAKAELARRELDRALTLNQTQAVSELDRRPAPPGPASGKGGADAGRRRAQGGPAQHRIHPRHGPDRRPGQPPSRQRRQSGARQRGHLDPADLDRLARSDLRLFRHGRGDLCQEQPALVRGQASQFARNPQSGPGDAGRRNQALA